MDYISVNLRRGEREALRALLRHHYNNNNIMLGYAYHSSFLSSLLSCFLSSPCLDVSCTQVSISSLPSFVHSHLQVPPLTCYQAPLVYCIHHSSRDVQALITSHSLCLLAGKSSPSHPLLNFFTFHPLT